MFVVEKTLLARSENKVCAAIGTLEGSVLEFWHRLAPAGPFLALLSTRDSWAGNIAGPERSLDSGYWTLFGIPSALLPVTLSCKGLLHPFLFAGLQVEGMTLYFLDNVFLLNLPLKPAESVFNRFALLQFHFSQTETTPPNFR